jgi:hypothetical protein
VVTRAAPEAGALAGPGAGAGVSGGGNGTRAPALTNALSSASTVELSVVDGSHCTARVPRTHTHTQTFALTSRRRAAHSAMAGGERIRYRQKSADLWTINVVQSHVVCQIGQRAAKRLDPLRHSGHVHRRHWKATERERFGRFGSALLAICCVGAALELQRAIEFPVQDSRPPLEFPRAG